MTTHKGAHDKHTHTHVLDPALEPRTNSLRYWYIFDVAEDAHSLVSLEQLLTWGSCQDWQGFRVNNVGGISFLAADRLEGWKISWMFYEVLLVQGGTSNKTP